jgi:uncharacterized membrane protein
VFFGPILVTLWLVWTAFKSLDRAILDPLGIHVPGLGIAILLALVTAFGFLTSNLLTRGLLRRFERILEKLPFVKLLHGSLRDLMNAFVGEQKKFDKPVLVDLSPGGHVRAFGFVTRDSLATFGFEDRVAVYLPQAYNFAGQLLVVPREAVHPVARDSGEIMAFIVSGGVTGRQLSPPG